MEGGEEISAEIIPHTKFKSAIYPYIPNSVSCLTPDVPVQIFSPKLDLVSYYLSPAWRMLIYICYVVHIETLIPMIIVM